MRPMQIALVLSAGILFSGITALAWTTPPASPPNSNVSAPLNVGSIVQTKTGPLLITNNLQLGAAGGSYLNFGATAGNAGYGVADFSGILKFKNSGGVWNDLSTIINNYLTLGPVTSVKFADGTTQSTAASGGGISGGSAGFVPKYSSATALAPSLIQDNGTLVGIGITPSLGKLHVDGGTGTGVWGDSSSGVGIHGDSTSNIGVYGTSASNVGVYGASAGANIGVYGQAAANYGVYGRTLSATYGGVIGYSGNAATYGILGYANAYSFYGNSTVYTAGNMNAAGYFHNSDQRLKANIQTSRGLEIVQKLRGVTFDWKKDGTPSSGVIAQEVEKVMPSAVQSTREGIKMVEYDQLIAPLIEAVKEQQTEIDSLRHEIEILKNSK